MCVCLVSKIISFYVFSNIHSVSNPFPYLLLYTLSSPHLNHPNLLIFPPYSYHLCSTISSSLRPLRNYILSVTWFGNMLLQCWPVSSMWKSSLGLDPYHVMHKTQWPQRRTMRVSMSPRAQVTVTTKTHYQGSPPDVIVMLLSANLQSFLLPPSSSQPDPSALRSFSITAYFCPLSWHNKFLGQFII